MPFEVPFDDGMFVITRKDDVYYTWVRYEDKVLQEGEFDDFVKALSWVAKQGSEAAAQYLEELKGGRFQEWPKDKFNFS